MTEIIYNDFEDELDAIRSALYEEIKDMTTEEHLAYIHAQVEPVMKKYGWKYATLTPVIPHKRERMPL